jgi:uncharacterized membrane protein (UPF0127 family)
MAALIDCPTPGGGLQVRVAATFMARGLGLLVGRPLADAEGLLIAPCSSVHTIGMRYPIDVVFLARSGEVLRSCGEVRAGRFRIKAGAHAVLELRAGGAARHGLRPGCKLAALGAVMGA